MTEAYVQRVWFSVIYKSTGKKKCDCGLETTAMEIVANNPQELTYVRSCLLYTSPSPRDRG